VIALQNGNRLEGWIVQQYLKTVAFTPTLPAPSTPAVTPTP
jgi:hypothetical protein